MKRRLVILTEIIAPYRIPVFNALAARTEVDLHVIFLAETDPGLRQWEVYRDEIRFSYEVLKSYRHRLGGFNFLLSRGVGAALSAGNPEVILSGGYNDLAMWQAQRWARARRVPFLLWSESNVADARRKYPWVESAKRRFMLSCQGYVVPGASAATYLRTYGVASDRIFVAPNAVDVERFSNGAAQARGNPEIRRSMGLPPRYLLYVGRLVRAKGVWDLLSAYAKLPERIREAVSLVLVGDGEEREQLVRYSREIRPGSAVFPGFWQRDQLPAAYAGAEALVFPTHSDTWGMVVNEAMACGIPVIASDVAGCVADMVSDGENGRVVPAGDQEGLARAMEEVLNTAELRRAMGQRSAEMSSLFTPQAWAEGIVRAVGGSGGQPRG